MVYFVMQNSNSLVLPFVDIMLRDYYLIIFAQIVVLGSPEGTSTTSTGSQILEQGSHDELMAKPNGFYKALVGAGERRKSDADLDVVAVGR